MPLWRQLIAQGRVWSNEPTWAAQRASRDPSHSVVVSMFEPPPIRLLAWPLAVGWAAKDVLLSPGVWAPAGMACNKQARLSQASQIAVRGQEALVLSK